MSLLHFLNSIVKSKTTKEIETEGVKSLWLHVLCVRVVVLKLPSVNESS